MARPGADPTADSTGCPETGEERLCSGAFPLAEPIWHQLHPELAQPCPSSAEHPWRDAAGISLDTAQKPYSVPASLTLVMPNASI